MLASISSFSNNKSKITEAVICFSGCMEDYFNSTDEKKKKKKSDTSFSICKSILNSKSKEESLV